MASRADLIIKINNDLADGTSITASEHRGVEQTIVNSCKPYNIGFFRLDVGGVISNSPLIKGGDVTSALCTSGGSGSVYTYVIVTMTNTMPSNNYYVKLSIENFTFTSEADRSLYSPVWMKHPTLLNTIYIGIREVSGAQDVGIWFEVMSLD